MQNSRIWPRCAISAKCVQIFYALHIINYQCRQCGQQNASSEESLITHRLYNQGPAELGGVGGTNFFLLCIKYNSRSKA